MACFSNYRCPALGGACRGRPGLHNSELSLRGRPRLSNSSIRIRTRRGRPRQRNSGEHDAAVPGCTTSSLQRTAVPGRAAGFHSTRGRPRLQKSMSTMHVESLDPNPHKTRPSQAA